MIDDVQRLRWLNEAIDAFNTLQNERAVTLAEKVIASESGDPRLTRLALPLVLLNAVNDSLPNRMSLACINRRYVEALREDPRFLSLPPWQGRRARPPGPLRIGYFWDFLGLSVDFCFSAFHNRERYQAIGVAPAGSARRLEGLEFDQVIEYDPADLAGAVEQIRSLDLDLLIDLNGRGNNEASDLIVEARVAVRQAMYGNVFWSTQSDSIDFLILDRTLVGALDPSATRERLVAIEEPIMAVRNTNWFPHDRQTGVPARPRRYRIGTPGNPNKLSESFLDLLAKCLSRIPDASFLYQSCQSLEALAELQRRLTSRGVEAERLELFVSGQIGYVEAINALDAAIDSIPYNGHLSSIEYLSLGTPIWSLYGQGLAQRYGSMILGCVGLEANLFMDPAALIDDLASRIDVKSPLMAADLARQVARSGVSDPLRATRLFEKAIDLCIAAI